MFHVKRLYAFLLKILFVFHRIFPVFPNRRALERSAWRAIIKYFSMLQLHPMSILSVLQSNIREKRWGQFAAMTGLAVWAVLLIGVFFSTQPTSGLYIDNQSTYFIQGLRLSGKHPYLESDWFAQTKPLHIAFTYLIAWLARWEILPGAIAVIDVLFRLVFLASAGLLVNALLDLIEPKMPGGPLRRAGLALSVITFYVLSLWPVFQLSDFFERIGVSSLALAIEKFGFYYSLGGFAAFRYYTEPASFSVLIFTALALMPYRRWRWSAALLGIAGLMHASYLIHSGALAGVMVLYLWVKGQRDEAFRVTGIYAAFVLPLVVYIATQLTDSQTAAANLILALERVPHHTQPTRWWEGTDTVHTAVIVASAALLWWKDRGLTRWAILATTLYVGIGIGLVLWTENPSLAILMPWRASGYLYAVSQLVMLTAGLVIIVKVLSRWPLFADSILLILPVALLIWSAMENGVFSVLAEEYENTATQAAYPFMERIRQETPADAVLLIPLRDGDYRLGAQRPIFVDWKSHPYKGSEVLDWWRRVEFVRAFYNLPASERQQGCQTAEADFYVLEEAQLGKTEQLVISWENLILVRCPGP